MYAERTRKRYRTDIVRLTSAQGRRSIPSNHGEPVGSIAEVREIQRLLHVLGALIALHLTAEEELLAEVEDLPPGYDPSAHTLAAADDRNSSGQGLIDPGQSLAAKSGVDMH